MDVLDFIASLVGSLAWPIVVVVALLVFKSQISTGVSALGKRVDHLRRLKGPGFDAEFGEEFKQDVENVKADVEALAPVKDEPDEQDEQHAISRFALREQSNPRLEIIESFILFESEVLRAAQMTGWQPSRHGQSLTSALKHLSGRFELPPNFLRSADRLRNLRNEAAHAPDFAISRSAAHDYSSTAVEMAIYLYDLVGLETQ